MDQQRWKQVETIFADAIELASGERESFVRKQCGDDDELFGEVMKLVRADDKAHSLFSGGAAEALGLPKQFSMVGRRIGSFELVREIGSGGMGVVYLGRRADGQFDQEVAIKLIKRGMDTEQILARFQIERQILARLDHPNIARLLDGGISEDGLPYFTMEYVEGLPIDVYCDKHRLGVEQRLTLFLAACEAVAYAQRNLVVHRDLKPANIVVTSAGQVKLLDFGIAKVLSDDVLAVEQEHLTRTGFRVMTPGYASPEQVRGEPVTTASDVYSLGVILYELLTGRRPYDVTGESINEIEKAIVSTDPRKPSTAVVSGNGAVKTPTGGLTDPKSLSEIRGSSPDRLSRRLSGDLDNICLMALRKDPVRRYDSVEKLREDIRRHLAGLPIMARAESLAYTFHRFVWRHRVAVTAAVAIMVLIGALVTFYTVRLSQERDKARTEARKAAEVSDFLTGLFEIADPLQSNGETVTARELLERGSERIATDLADQPGVQSNMLFVIGNAYYNLGLYESAISAQEQAYRLAREAYGERSEQVGKTLLMLASLQDINGSYDSAIVLGRTAVDILTDLRGQHDTLTANAINDLAVSLRHNGDFEESEVYYRKALALRKELRGPRHGDVAHTLNHLGRLVQAQGRLQEAEQFFREGLEIRREYFGTDRNADVGASYAALGGCLSAQGKYEEAVEMYRHAIVSFSSVVGESHPYTAGTIASCGRALLNLGRYKESGEMIRQAMAIQERILPQDHPQRSNSLYYLGDWYERQGFADSAETVFRQVLAIREKSYPLGNWQIAQVQGSLGEVLLEQGKVDEAARYIKDSYDALLEQLGDSSLTTQAALKRLKRLQEMQHP